MYERLLTDTGVKRIGEPLGLCALYSLVCLLTS